MPGTNENLGMRPKSLKYLAHPRLMNMHGKCVNDKEHLYEKGDRIKIYLGSKSFLK